MPSLEVAPGSKPLELSRLPPEIKMEIASNLSQIDAVCLSRTGKAMSECSVQRIYDRVVVEANYTQFSKEYCPRYTYINLLYSLKQFFRAKHRNLTRALHVTGLPDLANIYYVETHDLMHRFFAELHNLHELVWTAENFTPDHLHVLPNRPLLERLEVNINFAGPGPACEPMAGFEGLRILQIRPFANLKRLRHLLLEFLGSGGSEMRSLEFLGLARCDSDSPALLPARELRNLGSEPATGDGSQAGSADVETNTLHTLLTCQSAGRIRNLTKLSLNSIFVSEADATLLAESMHLPNLETLVLKKVAECGGGAEDRSGGFLRVLAPHFDKLRHLHLDFRETTRASIAPFLSTIPQLTSLDLIERMNDLKRACLDVTQLYSDYGASIARHGTLQKLSVEVRQEHSFCETVMPTPEPVLSAISSLHALGSLRLSSVNALANETFTEMLQGLSRLRFLDVFGVHSAGFLNLGLGMVHPNIYDEWFKVQHFAEELGQIQPATQYVRINQCVFECTCSLVSPRDTIDGWFDENVRV
ncbi:hypothetical protein METBIDRAFT_37627 [Metschnikowia bicuspidata var. bicuspidata NRRL YB-4993]|uniref:F-box domain-containing protein n=1 Tax=Metschnikowia bicuspidata var. bicuspidata NRRL YB-4993 TaxID=869754 RepID=A0A1A0HFW9_9ASCO|nr:hypothetical protein METBIDRAFT_37627 [Metschnikowia bicuspidata var. bicuspidata NRRL YB-4993]OBA23054.1 hypothetical protein METBIDRAFT_37627 [Metschnikowia bicuspidata var. bicuspidata NRRL YB-4993]